MDNDRLIITYSAIEAFRRCPEEFKLKYIHKVKKREKSEALIVGGIFGQLAQEYLLIKDEIKVYEKYSKILHDLKVENTKAYLKVVSMFAAFVNDFKANNRNDVINVHTNEKRLIFNYDDDTIIQGFADSLVLNNDDTFTIYEIKTTSSEIDHVVKILERTLQIRLYIWIARQMGLNVRNECLIHVVKKPSSTFCAVRTGRKTKPDETIDDALKRINEKYLGEDSVELRTIYFHDSEINEVGDIITEYVEAINFAITRDHLKNVGYGCDAHFTGCDMKSICFNSYDNFDDEYDIVNTERSKVL